MNHEARQDISEAESTTLTDDERFRSLHPDIPSSIKRFTYSTPSGHILESWERDPVTHLWIDTTLRDQMRERLADAQEDNTPHTALAHLLQGDIATDTDIDIKEDTYLE